MVARAMEICRWILCMVNIFYQCEFVSLLHKCEHYEYSNKL